VVGRIVSTLGRHDDRREDPEERDSKDECERSAHATTIAPGWSTAFQLRDRVG
jgi:hypothetical protein